MTKPQARFWKKVAKSSDCWEWIATKDEFGYGRFSYGGKNVRASRVSWMLTYGQIPKDLHVLHRCDESAAWAACYFFSAAPLTVVMAGIPCVLLIRLLGEEPWR